jgi:CDP-diacylglycerol--serine O-phosphatidyltransferase
MTDKMSSGDLSGPSNKGLTFEVEELGLVSNQPAADLKQAPRYKGVYLLPNLFTTGVLFAGFFAIVSAFSGAYAIAALAIFVGMVLDGLDGRIARLTGTQSAFGAEFDSLSDLVAFGVAPALLLYVACLKPLGQLALPAAFFLTACTAMRLARFNVQIASTDPRFFTGFPSPSSAGVVTSFIWFIVQQNWQTQKWVPFVGLFIALAMGMLMVSRVKFYSFKELGTNRVPFFMLFIVLLILVALIIDPVKVLFIIFACYALSGILSFKFSSRG